MCLVDTHFTSTSRSFLSVSNSEWFMQLKLSFLPKARFGLRVVLYLYVCLRQSRACPRDNLSTIQARITRIGSEV